MMMGQRDWIFQQEASKPRAVTETLGRFWSYFRRYSHVLLAAGALVIVGTYLQVEIPILMGQAIDCFIAPNPATCWYAPWIRR